MNTINYGLIGNGLLATHFRHFFTQEGINFTPWSRKEDTVTPWEKLKNCSILIIIITDSQIEKFILNNKNLMTKKLVHFSGALNTSYAIGVHPLMTFSTRLYSLQEYRNISFVGDSSKLIFNEIFPKLKNNYYQIDNNKKEFYHSLCVVSGNFTTMLWQKVFIEFEQSLNIPKEALFPYLNQIKNNLEIDYKNSLTGPIKRQDKTTIKKNIKAIKNKLWKKMYKLFNKIYKEGNL